MSKFLMKALVATVTNTKDGSILVLDPDHKTDGRARYPRVPTMDDVLRLEKEGLAERHTGRVPHIKGLKRQADPGAPGYGKAVDAAPGQKVVANRGPRQETDDEADAAADLIEGGGIDDDGEGTGEAPGQEQADRDPTAAPA